MNTKRILAAVLALLLVLGLCACGQSGSDTTTEGTTQETTQETTQAETTQAETTASGSVYTIKVVDEGGNPIAGAYVQICQGETCRPGMTPTGEDGITTIAAEEGEYKASFMQLPEGYTYVDETQEFYFEDGSMEITIVLKAVA